MTKLAALTLIIAAHSAISAATQPLAFDPIPNQFLGSSPFSIVAQAVAGRPVTFTSTTPAICKTTGNLVTLRSAGTCSITASQSGFVSVTRAFTVTLTQPAAFFVGGDSVTTGEPSYTVAVADFNGDGEMDFATTQDSAGTVSVMLGDGAGGFTAAQPIRFAQGSYPYTLVAGDFNGDNIPDLAVSLVGVNGVAVLLGDGSGGFAASTGVPFATDSSPFCLVAGDFNGDGIQDLVTASFDSNDLTVLLGDGTGRFSATTIPVTGAGFSLFSIAVGDFNGDGNQDIVAGTGDQFLTILLGNGKGAFTPGAPSSAGAVAAALTVTVGDFNGDGIPDLATENRDSTMSILLGDGSGGFTLQPGTLPLVEYPSAIVVGDFNGDGIQDLVIMEQFSGRLMILHGDGTGRFSPDPSGPFAASGDIAAVAVADFNGDGIPDFVTTAGAVLFGFTATGQTHQTIMFGPFSDTVYSASPIALVASASSGLAVSVLSAIPDICQIRNNTLSFPGTGQCTLFANQPGNSVFAAAPTVVRSFAVNPLQQSISFALPASIVPPPLSFFLTGTATSTYTVSYISNTPSVCIVSGNMVTLIDTGTCSITAMQAADGYYDSAPNVTRSVLVGKGLVPTTFNAIPDHLLGTSPFELATQATPGLPVSIRSATPNVCSAAGNLVSLVQTGVCEITATQTGNALYNASPPVTRTFNIRQTTAAISYAQSGSPIALGNRFFSTVIGDFNGDETPDILVANGTGAIEVLMGNGLGSFAVANGPYQTYVNPTAIVVGDFNGDRFQDVAMLNGNFGITVLLSDGLEGFAPSLIFYGSDTSPVSLVVGDFNGDGNQDLAVSNSSDLTLTVLLGDGSGGFNPVPGSPLYVGATGPLVVGDFNGDGIQDLANIDPYLSTLTVLLGDGSGGFAASAGPALPIGLGSRAITAGDFNADGRPDLAIARPGAGVLVLLGDGSGGFTPATGSPFPAGSVPASIVAGDFNGDGIQDLATANHDDSDITILLGDGAGGFTPSPTGPVAAGIQPVSLMVADFNRDGIEDFITANARDNNLTVFLGQPLGTKPQTITFAPLPNVPLNTGPFRLAATSSSNLAVEFASATPAVCTASGTTMTVLTAGGCVITATERGSAVYAPAEPVTQSFTVLFSDIAPADFDYAPINAVSQLNIANGCGSNNFCPNENVTRDEMAMSIVRAIYGNDDFIYNPTPYFTDVTPATFGFKWIQKLKDLGITTGCTLTTYCPGDVVSRDQMAIFIIRARLGLTSFAYPSTPYFTDATAASEFAFPWIQRMRLDNITSGCTATTYCPSAPVTRGEMAVFIMRGLFNRFLPDGTPVVTQISPSTIAAGTSGIYTITGVNTHFAQATTHLSPIPGMTIGAISVTSPTTLNVQLADTGGVPTQPYSLQLLTGSEQAVLPNGLALR